eukprot:2923872-Amphidinium_carterae.1
MTGCMQQAALVDDVMQQAALVDDVMRGVFFFSKLASHFELRCFLRLQRYTVEDAKKTNYLQLAKVGALVLKAKMATDRKERPTRKAVKFTWLHF